MNLAERTILYLFGSGWLLGGLLYSYAGIVAPAPFLTGTLHSPDSLKQFFEISRAGWLPYTLAFTLFVVADFAQILVGVIFYRIFGTKEWKNETMRLAFLVAGLCGIIADLITLSNWNLIATFQPAWPDDHLIGLWNILLLNQYNAIYLSVMAAATAGLGLGLVHVMSRDDGRFSARWRLLTQAIVLLSLIFVVAIVYGSYSGNLLPMGAVFMLTSVIAVPAWCFWTAHLLSGKNAQR